MAFRGWDRMPVLTGNGEKVDAVMPVIISASRATDIPAFHAAWFMERLREGYVFWRNPFNAAQVQYLSFLKTRVVVFWSKNPAPLIPYLHEIDALGINYYFQFTLNDYEADALEPMVPPVAGRVETFRRLSDSIGRERVIWRFDPLVRTGKVTTVVLLDRIASLAEKLQGYTDKLVISFADIDRYRAVQRRLDRSSSGAREFTREEKASFASQLVAANRAWGFDLASCAEEACFEGIEHSRCIDDRLLASCFGDDTALMDFLRGGASMFPGERPDPGILLKDRGQRKACGCMVSKDIGRYGTCQHDCLYCYATR
ncbi:MAG: DUF1848 domain-containing protein [Chlorobiaceae bacterium]|nr:DUF1848 domain-containing protein [Chlorobiaceae bacterium]